MAYENLGAYGAFLQAQDRNRAAGMQNLQQGMGLLQMQQAMQAAQRRSMVEQMAQAAAGDPDKLMRGYLQLGDAEGAARVAAVGETMRKAEEARRMPAVLAEITQRYGPRTDTVTEGYDDVAGTPGAVSQVQRPIDLQGMGAAMIAVPGLAGAGANLLSVAEAAQGRRDAQMQAAAARMAELRIKMEDAAATREQRAQAAAEAAQLRRDLVQMRIDADRSNREFAAAMRQPAAPVVTEVMRDGKAVKIDARTGAVIGESPPKSAQAALKQLPVNAAKALLENSTNLRRAETALSLMEGKEVDGIKGDPNATGWKGFAPDPVLQRMDPAGIATRAAIADLGSLVIHDRSGAAVTAAEFPRLQPFIPSPRDDPSTVKKKLQNFVSVYRTLVNEQADFYEASGYSVPRTALKSGAGNATPAQVRNDDDFARLPSGAEFIDPNGVRRRKP